MKIRVNGKDIEFTADKIMDLLEKYKLDPQRVVVERNGEIVHREKYKDGLLGDGDVIEIVRFVGGG